MGLGAGRKSSKSGGYCIGGLVLGWVGSGVDAGGCGMLALGNGVEIGVNDCWIIVGRDVGIGVGFIIIVGGKFNNMRLYMYIYIRLIILGNTRTPSTVKADS